MSNTNNNLAYVFPGQGSQSVGMLSELSKQYPIIKNLFDKASVLLNYDLFEIIANGPKEKLDQTEYTQPAIMISSYALYQIHEKKFNLAPAYMAGHSLGEYTALICSNAISFEEAVYLVSKRAKYMADAVPNGMGAMAAILGLDDKIESICDSIEGEVTPANYNSIGQIVISGQKQAVEEAMEQAKSSGAKLVKLVPVSIPSHCPLMAGAAKNFEEHLNNSGMVMPQIKIINNVTAKPLTSVNEIKDSLLKQFYSPVQWVKSIEFMVENNITTIVECGPGKVLAGLNKRIDKSITTYSGVDLELMATIFEKD